MAYKINSHGKLRWRAKFWVNGEPFQGNFLTKHEAEAWKAEMKALGGQVKQSGTIPTVSEWVDATLEEAKVRGCALSTMKEKKFSFEALLAVVDPMAPITSIDIKIASKCLTTRMEAAGGKASNKLRKNLITAWNWGTRLMELPERNPFKLVQRFPEAKPERYVPSEDDFWKVVDAAETQQDKTMLMAYLHTGARKNELLRLRWADLDLLDRRIRLYTRKRQGGGLEHDTIPMTVELRDQLEAHRKSLGFISEFVFLRPQTLKPYRSRVHLMEYLCKTAGVKHFGFHAIRHLSASVLYKAGYPIAVIQKVLRHKSANTTARYLHDLIGIDVELDAAFKRPEEATGNGKSKTPEACASRA